MYGDLETYDVCWFAVVPMYDPWFDEGEYEDEEYEDCPHETRIKPYKRTAKVISIRKR